MMVTNLVKNPTANLTTSPNMQTDIICDKLMAGVTYYVSMYVTVRGGTVSFGSHTIDNPMRINWTQKLSVSQTNFRLNFTVLSGKPTVIVTGMLICKYEEFTANAQLINEIKYFSGDTMPIG